MRNAPWTCSGSTGSRRLPDSDDTSQKRKRDSEEMLVAEAMKTGHRTYLDNWHDARVRNYVEWQPLVSSPVPIVL